MNTNVYLSVVIRSRSIGLDSLLGRRAVVIDPDLGFERLNAFFQQPDLGLRISQLLFDDADHRSGFAPPRVAGRYTDDHQGDGAENPVKPIGRRIAFDPWHNTD